MPPPSHPPHFVLLFSDGSGANEEGRAGKPRNAGVVGRHLSNPRLPLDSVLPHLAKFMEPVFEHSQYQLAQ